MLKVWNWIKERVGTIKWNIDELRKTFSNQPSFYSSKRIERAILFLSANTMLWYMTVHLMQVGKLDYIGAIGIYAAQMVYAGYQVKRTEEAKIVSPTP